LCLCTAPHTPQLYTLSLHDALPISAVVVMSKERADAQDIQPLVEIVAHGMSAERYAYLHTVPAMAMQNALKKAGKDPHDLGLVRSEEHTSELQSLAYLVCRLLLEKK